MDIYIYGKYPQLLYLNESAKFSCIPVYLVYILSRYQANIPIGCLLLVKKANAHLSLGISEQMMVISSKSSQTMQSSSI